MIPSLVGNYSLVGKKLLGKVFKAQVDEFLKKSRNEEKKKGKEKDGKGKGKRSKGRRNS